MLQTNVAGLKNNPSVALRQAKLAPVVVMNRLKPDALIVSIEQVGLSEPRLRLAMAVALFQNGGLSLSASARFAQMTLANMILHLSRLGIPVLDLNEDELTKDMDTLDQWLAPKK